MHSLLSDHALAARLADEAGAALMELRHSSSLQGIELKDAADQLANRVLLESLGTMRPDDGLLSEESPDDARRLDRERVWVIDPLDGTREFAELDRDDWAVHVGLAIKGEPAVGAVALPVRDEVFSTGDHPRTPSKPGNPPTIVVSRSRPPSWVSELAGRVGAEIVPMGSAGAKTIAVVRGEADAYVHSGGQYEWDSCAPVAVALAAGLHASRLDGSPLAYNQPDPYLPDLLVCRAELRDVMLSGIAELSAPA